MISTGISGTRARAISRSTATRAVPPVLVLRLREPWQRVRDGPDDAFEVAGHAEITLRMICSSFARASGWTTPAASSWAIASSRQRRASARV